jgi:hypothetical protein
VTKSGANDIRIAALDYVEIVLQQWSWEFAAERRAEIARHFAEIQRRRSAVWNGRVLLLHRCAIDGGALHGACFETDYASFCSWRDWDFPDPTISNVFAASALRSADGAFLVGEMASSTANAGLVTFPCGTPEPADVNAAGRLDLAANLGRELLEETGIGIHELDIAPGWTMVRDRGYLALLKVAGAREDAEALRARILRHLAREQRPEFIDIRVLRSPADLQAAMPPFITAFLRDFWS